MPSEHPEPRRRWREGGIDSRRDGPRAQREPRSAGACDRRRRDDDRHLHRRSRRRLRGRQGADHAGGRVGRLHALIRGRPRAVGLDPGALLPEHRLGHLQRNRDAQPAALAPGAADRRDRHRRAGGLPADRARDPDLPRLFLLGPAPPRHPFPQRAAGPARADEGSARPHRRARHGGAAAARGGRAAGRRRAARRRGRGHLHLAAVQLSQRRARAAGRRDRRGGEGEARARR